MLTCESCGARLADGVALWKVSAPDDAERYQCTRHYEGTLRPVTAPVMEPNYDPFPAEPQRGTGPVDKGHLPQ